MSKSFKDLRKQMRPDAQERSHKKARQLKDDTCPSCYGLGFIEHMYPDPVMSGNVYTTCPLCNGRGYYKE